jgi:glycerol-3-phosphate dehydrogenase (NAD(P)+)
MHPNDRIAVVGGGSWGTALSILLGKKYAISLWVREEDSYRGKSLAQIMHETRVNSKYLPNARFPDSVDVSPSLEEVLRSAGLVITAVPTQFLRLVAREAGQYIHPRAVICSASKGLELDTFYLPTDILYQETGKQTERIVALSGPSHAEKVAANCITSVVVASEEGCA